MNESIRRTLADNDGVITRRGALAAGLSSSAIGRLVDSGAWSAAGQGVYVAADRVIGDRARMRIACARVHADAILGGTAAAWWQGIGERPPTWVPVFAPRGRHGLRIPGVDVTHRDLDERDVVRRSGLAVSALPLAVLDAAASEGTVSVLDQALLRGRVSMDQLHASHARYPGRRGAGTATRVLAAAASGARSEAERVVVALLRRAAISGWRANDEASGYLGDFVFDDDRVLVEVDGMAFHTDAETFQRDRRRQNELVNAGWAVLKFTWTDVTERPDYVIATIRQALKRSRSGVSR